MASCAFPKLHSLGRWVGRWEKPWEIQLEWLNHRRKCGFGPCYNVHPFSHWQMVSLPKTSPILLDIKSLLKINLEAIDNHCPGKSLGLVYPTLTLCLMHSLNQSSFHSDSLWIRDQNRMLLAPTPIWFLAVCRVSGLNIFPTHPRHLA